jgi:sodium/bile acid cotransporter 7
VDVEEDYGDLKTTSVVKGNESAKEIGDEELRTEPTKAKEEPTPKQLHPVLRILKNFLSKYWFLLGLGLAIGLAAAFPDLGKKGGYLKTDLWFRYVATTIVFLLTGLTLKSQVLGGALLLWKFHIVTLIISLGIIPLVGWGIGSLLLTTNMNSALASGLIIATCCPTTVSSNVIMTIQAAGNEAAAVVGAILGNIIGIFVSPILILAYARVSAPPPYSKLFFDLSVTVLIPLCVGQAIRYFFPKLPPWLQARFNIGIFNNCMILLMVWVTFCETFAAQLSMQAWEIVTIVVLDGAMYLAFAAGILLGSYYLLRVPLKPFARPEAIAMSFVGATKTIALGIPLIQIIYADDPNLGIYAAPLLIYHAAQLILGALTIPVMKSWKLKGDPPLAAIRDDEEIDLGEVTVEQTKEKTVGMVEVTVDVDSAAEEAELGQGGAADAGKESET